MARVNNELIAAGLDGDGPLKVEQCLPFDQMHYLGEEAMQEGGKALNARAGSKLLDIGAGYGGPARYMALTFECEVVGLELQKDLVDGCTQLSARMSDQLQGRATFRQGSATDPKSFEGLEGQMDGIYSMLTILHIPERHKVWPLAFNVLKPGGRMYHEDFYQKRPFTPEEEKLLVDVVGCAMPLPTKEQYIAQLEDAGFTEVEVEDVTDAWSPFVKGRRAAYVENSERHARVQGTAIRDSMLEFYAAIDALFHAGNLGGARITATKSESCDAHAK